MAKVELPRQLSESQPSAGSLLRGLGLSSRHSALLASRDMESFNGLVTELVVDALEVGVLWMWRRSVLVTGARVRDMLPSGYAGT